MNYPDFDQAMLGHTVKRISEWIDSTPENQAMTPLEQLMFRTVIKGDEEVGEFTAALVGMTGQNPRKGVTHTRAEVLDEALDVCATWLLGVEHMTGNKGHAVRMLHDHINRIEIRMAESRYRHGEPGGLDPERGKATL